MSHMNPSFVISGIALILAVLAYPYPIGLQPAVILLAIAVLLWAYKL